MRTIPRSHKAKVAEVRERFTKCVIRSLDYSFEARPAEAETAWKWFDQNPKTKLTEKVQGKVYLIQPHCNLWWELTLPEAKEEK